MPEYVSSSSKVQRQGKTYESSKFPFVGFALSIVILGFLAYINPSSECFESIPGPDLAWTVPPVAVMLPIIALALLKPLLNRVFRRSLYTYRDLVLMYGMLWVGGLVISRGFFSYFIFSIMYPAGQVMVFRERRYAEWVERLPRVMYPQSEDAVLGFWKGSSTVPWNEWILPILLWSSFVFVFGFAIICLYAIVRRQWEDREHLRYPLAEMTLCIVGARDESTGGFSWSNPLLLIGMGVSAVFMSLPNLKAYWPIIPAPVTSIQLGQYVSSPLLKQAWMAYPEFTLFFGYPLTIGIGYLIATELSFSLWFLYLIQRGIRYIFLAKLGWLVGDMHMHAEVSETAGAYIALSLVYLWYARHDLKEMFRKAFGRRGHELIDDSEEPLRFRAAVVGLVISLVYLIVFSSYAMFASIPFALLYFLMFFGVVIASMRFRAEAGIPTTNMFGQKLMAPILETFGVERPKTPIAPLATSLDNQWFRANMYAPFAFGPFGLIASVAADQYKMAKDVGISRRGITRALMFSIAISVLLAFVFGLPVIYRNGATMAGTHYQFMGSRAVEVLRPWGFDAEPKYWNLIPFLILGAGGTFLVSYLRTAYIWWPIHPIAYALSTANFLWILAFPMFIAWICKVLTLRWGGSIWYKKLTPAFMGLIIGQVLAQSLWAGIGLLRYLIA